MDFSKLKNLAKLFVENFNNIELRMGCARFLKGELDGLETALREKGTEEYLKRTIIVLNDVIRINSVEDMIIEQAQKILEIINQLKDEEINKQTFRRLIKGLRDTGLFILPITEKVFKTTEEVFEKNI